MNNAILEKKVKAYSALAGCIIGSFDIAQGQVVYTDLTTDVVIQGDGMYELDLNNDGGADFYITVYEEYNWTWGTNHTATVSILGNSVANSYNFPGAFDFGDTIGPNLTWEGNDVLAHNFDFFGGGTYSSSTSGNWINAIQKFLALRFTSNGAQHYGWAKLSVSVVANKVTIHSYAYETVPDSSITAGEKACPPYYLDADGDFHGSSADPGMVLCSDPGLGYSKSNADCDDTNTEIVPRSPLIAWEKSFGGTGNDNPQCILQTSDGGFVIAGSTYSADGEVTGNHGSWDCWIVKLDTASNMQWQKCLGGSNPDYANSILQTTDGGFIVAGAVLSNDGDVTVNNGGYDYWVVKLDSNGAIEWQKSYGGVKDDMAYSISQTQDGGFILGGYSSSNNGDVSGNHGSEDYWIVKLSHIGDLEWQRSLGGTTTDKLYSVQETTDGGFIAGGYSRSYNGDVSGNHGQSDFWIVKLGNTGSLIWEQSLGGDDDDEAYSIMQTNDGGYIVGGNSRSNNGDVSGNHGYIDYWVVKLDATGNIEWQKSLGGSDADWGYSVRQTNDGGFVVAGSAYSSNGDVSKHFMGSDYWIVKLGVNGNIEGENSFGGNNSEAVTSIQQTSDSGLIVAGYSGSPDEEIGNNIGGNDFWIVKLHLPPGGIEICNHVDDNCNGTIDDGLIFSTSFIDSDGDTYGNPDSSVFDCVIPTGFVPDNNDCDDSNADVNPSATEISINGIDDNCNGYTDEFPTGYLTTMNEETSFMIFPNPSAGKFMIDLTINNNETVESVIEVINLLGQTIYSAKAMLRDGKLSREVTLPYEALNGVYLLKVSAGGHLFTTLVKLEDVE
ncbi:MAG TPA: MopE-related protein [Cyclobacteriaceae bacterium]|nr:MopE-related protein [Cyclobacteriaceae bacterium]